MIKLTKKQSSQHETVIQIDGRLDVHTLHELRKVVESCDASGRPTLDLSGLTAVDLEGRALLVSLRESGCRLVGGSMYINRLLQEV